MEVQEKQALVMVVSGICGLAKLQLHIQLQVEFMTGWTIR
jgi:hypothetical protein